MLYNNCASYLPLQVILEYMTHDFHPLTHEEVPRWVYHPKAFQQGLVPNRLTLDLRRAWTTSLCQNH